MAWRKREKWNFQRALEFYERGATFDQLALRFGIAATTISRRFTAKGVPPRRRGWIIPTFPKNKSLQPGPT